jgi:hypothetical protein
MCDGGNNSSSYLVVEYNALLFVAKHRLEAETPDHAASARQSWSRCVSEMFPGREGTDSVANRANYNNSLAFIDWV